MKYLVLVGHATLPEGIEAALEMLLGSRSFVLSCGMDDGMGADAYRTKIAARIAPITANDEVVLLADIAGGSPLKNALVALDDKGLGDKVRVFAGMNLPMALSALMALEDGLDLDAIGDAAIADGTAAVKQV